MSEPEATDFLAVERTVVCATHGPRGWPHLMPLWYVLRAVPESPGAPELWAWTYASSQKARNLERDPRATLQVEAGERYDQLRGVMLETEAQLHHDTDVVRALGREIFARYAVEPGCPPPSQLPDGVGEMVDRQASKRVAMQFHERRRASWDHRKLAGTY